MPPGISDRLRAHIQEQEIERVLTDAGEFLCKIGRAIKCMIANHGPKMRRHLALNSWLSGPPKTVGHFSLQGRKRYNREPTYFGAQRGQILPFAM